MTVTRGTVGAGTGAPAIPAFSATQHNKRDVLDYIKLNYARNLKLIALLQEAMPSKDNVSLKNGKIKQTEVSQIRFECFNFTDWSKTVTCSSFSGTTLTLNSTAELKAYDSLYYFDNSTGKTISARIDSITNTTVCEITSVGDTAFSPSADTVLGIGPTMYPQNSSNPTMIQKDFDNVYNTLQIVREPVAISGTMLKSEFYATKDYFKLLKLINLVRFYEKLERGFLFGNRASGAVNTTSGGAALTSSFTSSRGLLNWAANVYDMNGSMTNFKINTELPRVLPTVGEGDPMLCVCGFDVQGRINEMVADKVQYNIDFNSAKTTLREFGINTTIVRTQTFAMELLNHQAFNEGDLAKTAMIFNPNNVEFVHLPERGIHPIVGIEENDRDGKVDEVMAEFGCRVNDGGQSIALIRNCW
jgi:hypothetical protein